MTPFSNLQHLYMYGQPQRCEAGFPGAGEAPFRSDATARPRPESVRDGETAEGRAANRECMAAAVPSAGTGRAASSRASRAQVAVRRRATGTAGVAVAGRPRGTRLPHAPVDLSAGGSPDRRGVRGRLPRRPRLEDPAGTRLEPATPARPGAGAQRKGAPHLAAQDFPGP